MANKELIKAIGEAAEKWYSTYKILPSMTIAQACLESRWGESGLAKDCHNYFGMKWTSTCGTSYKEYKTQEQQKDGSVYSILARFRNYTNLVEGIKGYYDFLNYSRYRNLFGITDYREACRLIKEDGWATDIMYTSKLISIIEEYKLWKYDLQVIYPKGPTAAITPKSNFLSIIWLQDRLNSCREGKNIEPLIVDGYYGEKTRAAVLWYWKQRKWETAKISTGWQVYDGTKKALLAEIKA